MRDIKLYNCMSDHLKSIGVDFGGTSIKMAVCSGSTILQRSKPIETQDLPDTHAIIAAMCDCARQLLVDHPDVVAVGLGIPAWVDFERGVIGRLVNVPAFDGNTPVRDLLQEQLGLPVFVDNDANCMAYAEWKLGAGQGLSNVVSITLGTGLGGGIIVNDQMLRSRGAGELGMCSIDYKGKPGPYGNRGGIEEYLGNQEVAADAMQRYAAAGIERSLEQCNPYALECAALEGDQIAIQVYTDFAERLACLVMNLMYSIAPEMFIFGGGMSKAGALLFGPLERFLKEQLMPTHIEALRLCTAQFGTDAGILGAALIALDETNKRVVSSAI